MSKTQIVNVELAERSYEILVGENILSASMAKIKEVIQSDKVVIITDKNVRRVGHLKSLESALKKSGIASRSIVLGAGEKTKSFKALEELLNKLLSFRPDRKITLIALGGGVIGDITGFAASVLLRGVDFIQIPTTLLAMVDSSVGGKTGINTKYGKNLIGSFYQPKLVIADVSLLKTLPKREILAGYAEVIKYAFIGDRVLFDILDNTDNIDYMFCVAKSCKAKADIVSADERESGNRALLNLGHTFGHALEAETGYSNKLLHGEAVAIGMVMAFQYSYAKGLCPKTDVDKVVNHIKRVGLPTSPLDISKKFRAGDLVGHMMHDKKNKDGKLVLILANGIGKSFIKKGVDKNDLKVFIKDLLEGKFNS